MTNLTEAAQAVSNAAKSSLDWEAGYLPDTVAAAALRSAANHLTDATSSHTLYAIADELEGITYGTYRCNLEAQ